MAVASFGDSEVVLAFTAGVFSRYKPQISSIMLRIRKTLEIAGLGDYGECSLRFDANKADKGRGKEQEDESS